MFDSIENRLSNLERQLEALKKATRNGLVTLETDIEKLEEFVSVMDYEQEQLIKKVSECEDKLDGFESSNNYVTNDDLKNICDDLESRIDDLEREIDNLQKD